MDKGKLVEVVREFGVVWAPEGQEFELASGAKSRYYVDFSRVMMTPLGAQTVVDAILAALGRLDYDCIGGPSSGADPIIGGLMAQLCIPAYVTGWHVRGFTIRKEPKGRGPGAGDLHEGYLEPGCRAVVVEDVTTSGGSVLKAIKAVEARGAKVVKVLTLLDRLAGATDKLKEYDFQALLTIRDLGIA